MFRKAWLIASVVAALAGCAAENEAPVHWVVVYDSSNSGLALVANNASLQQAFGLWVQQALYLPGSSFEVMRVGQSRDTVREVVPIRVPAAWGPGVRQAQKRFVLEGRRFLAGLELEEGGSAIAESIQLAALRLREQEGERYLLVFSDLRQYTPRVWNFERVVPDAEAFIAWLEQEQLLADLRGIRVEIAGVHARRGPDAPEFTAAQEARLRQVWRAALTQMGAHEVELRSTL